MAALILVVGFLSGCNDFSGESVRASSASSDRAELSRFAERYGSASTPGNAGYRIGPQDVLEITIFKAPDLSKSVQVAEVGTINLPLVGEVTAVGKTPAGLERDLAARLGAKYIKSPQVTVFVKEYNSQRVTVEGAVRKPGVFAMRGNDSLMQVIARAEGLDREIASNNVAVFRDGARGREVARYDIEQIRAGAAHDPEIRRGDVIVVEDSSMRAAFQVLRQLAPLAGPFVVLATAL